jgi:signal transduction histidine kinase
VDEQTRAPVANPVERVLSRGEIVELANHTLLVARNGEEHPVEDSAAPIRDEHGAMCGVVLVFHDVAVRRQAELRLLQQADELERKAEARTAELSEKVAELEAFSYSVSHDLRTPLRAIQGYCGLLLDELQGRIGRETYGYLERVDVAARRLDRLVVDVLTFSSIARGPLRMERVELEKFLPQVIELYPLWREPVTTIELCRPLLPVLAYEAFLTQCVTNLLSNAVKFIAPGDKPRITVSTERHDRMVRLWVEDNGIGVLERDRERIFQMFERGTTDQRFSGTGIGLAVVRKAAQRMGGRVGVEPKPGGGSRFWVELPAADA